MCTAEQIFRRFLGPNPMVEARWDCVLGGEHFVDPDGREYLLGYESSRDGRRAAAYCVSNPWDPNEPSAGAQYHVAHVAEDGLLCLADGATRRVDASPFGLEFAIRRARYWCVAFSYFKETGVFVDP